MPSFRVLKPLPEAQPVLHAPPPPKPHSNPHLRLLLPAKASRIRAQEAAEQSADCWPQGIPGPEPGDSELPKTDRGGLWSASSKYHGFKSLCSACCIEQL